MISRKVLAIFVVVYSFAAVDKCFASFPTFEFSQYTATFPAYAPPGIRSDTISCLQTASNKVTPAVLTAVNGLLSAFINALQGIVNSALKNPFDYGGIQNALYGYYTTTNTLDSKLISALSPVTGQFQTQCSPSVSPAQQRKIVQLVLESVLEFAEDVQEIVVGTYDELVDFAYDCNTFGELIYGGVAIITTGANYLFAALKNAFNGDTFVYVSLSLLKNVNNSVCTVIVFRSVAAAIHLIRLVQVLVGGLLTYFAEFIIASKCLTDARYFNNV